MSNTVTLFKGVKGTKSQGYDTLANVWSSLCTDPALCAFNERLMAAKKESKAAFDELKTSECLAFVVGRFPLNSRNDADCIEYVPILGFDIDAMGMEAIVADTIRDLRGLAYVRAAYASPSREGLRIFVECTANLDSHKQYYEAISGDLSAFLKIPTDKVLRQELKAQGLDRKAIEAKIKDTPHIDSSTSNVGRLWFYSGLTDDLFYYNPHSHIYTISTAPQVSTAPISARATPAKGKMTTDRQAQSLSEAEVIELCIYKVEERQAMPRGRNNDVHGKAKEMVKHGVSKEAAIRKLSTYEEPGLPLSKILASIDSAYKSTEREYNDAQILAYARIVNPRFATVTQVATAAPQTDQGEQPNESNEELANQNKFIRIKKFLEARYEFRKNTVSLLIEYRQKGKGENWEPLNENNLFRDLMEHGGFVGVESSVLILIKSDFVPEYDPFLSYFECLPKWNADQDPDYIAILASYVKAKDPVWFAQQFKKMLVRTVACAIGRIPFNKHCFVLKSEQNDGKSSFIRFLCPPQLSDYITDHIDLDNKDGRLALCQNFIINLDELAVFSRHDVTKTKALFTIEKVKERLPYDRTPSNVIRRASFMASTNEDEFLVDDTGNVRWLVFEIEGIQHDNGGPNGYNAAVNIDQVFSQVYTLLNSGFQVYLSKEEIAKSESNNREYKVRTLEGDLILEYFAPSDADDGEFMTTVQVMKAIEGEVKQNINQIKLGKELKYHGFKRVQKYMRELERQAWGYYVKRLKT